MNSTVRFIVRKAILTIVVLPMMLIEAHSQVIFVGTPGQVSRAQMLNQLESGLKDFATLTRARALNQAELDQARRDFWHHQGNEEFRAKYARLLYEKDMHFFSIRFQNHYTKSNMGSLVEGLLGMGKIFDGGIGSMCDREFDKWTTKIFATFDANSTGPFDTEALANSIRINTDAYLDYVLVRDRYEFLFNNPISPLFKEDPYDFIAAAYFITKDCSDWDSCQKVASNMLSGLNRDQVTSLALGIKKVYSRDDYTFHAITLKELTFLIDKFLSYNTKRPADTIMEEINQGFIPLFDTKRKKGVILAFTSSTCPNDYYAIEKLNDLQTRYKDSGLDVIAINAYANEENSIEEMKRKAAGNHYSFLYFKDTNGQLAERFEVTTTPFICVLNFTPEGQYYIKYKGPIFDAEGKRDPMIAIKDAADSIVMENATFPMNYDTYRPLGCKIEMK